MRVERQGTWPCCVPRAPTSACDEIVAPLDYELLLRRCVANSRNATARSRAARSRRSALASSSPALSGVLTATAASASSICPVSRSAAVCVSCSARDNCLGEEVLPFLLTNFTGASDERPTPRGPTLAPRLGERGRPRRGVARRARSKYCDDCCQANFLHQPARVIKSGPVSHHACRRRGPQALHFMSQGPSRSSHLGACVLIKSALYHQRAPADNRARRPRCSLARRARALLLG